MEVVIVVSLCIVAIVIYMMSSKKYSTSALAILEKNFEDNSFSKVNSLSDLINKLDVVHGKKHSLAIPVIIKDAKHKIEVFTEHKIKKSKAFQSVDIQKILINCIVDYAIKHDFNEKETIKLLLIVLKSESLSELFEENFDDKMVLETFFNLLEELVRRYHKRMKEL